MNAPLPREARVILERSQSDPVWFCEHVLGVHLWDKQKDIARSTWKHRRTSVASANGIGKSFLGACLAVAFGSVFKDAVIVTTATTFRQVKGILWREIAKVAGRSRIPLGIDVLATEIRWPNGSLAIGMTAPEHDESKLQGFRGAKTLIIADEAGGLAAPIVEAIRAMLTGEDVHLLMIGNPTDPTSEFAASFQQPNVETFKVSAFDTPNFTAFGLKEEHFADGTWKDRITGPLPAPHLVTPAWVAEAYTDWGPDDPRYDARVKANFPEESEHSLVKLAWTEAAAERYADTEPGLPIELGQDVARSGGDDSSLWLREGIRARRISRVHGHDTMQVVGGAANARKEHNATSIKCDVIGVGAGVVDRLDEMGEPVVGVNVAEGASDSVKFANKRAEYFWALRERFSSGDIAIDPKEREVVKQLHKMRWTLNSKGQILIEKKDETKKRLNGKSPDDADALMLTFAPAQRKRYVIV